MGVAWCPHLEHCGASRREQLQGLPWREGTGTRTRQPQGWVEVQELRQSHSALPTSETIDSVRSRERNRNIQLPLPPEYG